MDIKATYASLEDIPTDVVFSELFTQKGDVWEFTGMTGIRTQADVDRVEATLKNERAQHKTTREKLGVWGEMSHDDVVSAMDRIPELEAAAGDKLDEAGIEAIVTKRVDGTLRSKLAPLERQLKAAETARDDALTENMGFKQTNTDRIIEAEILTAAKKARLQDGADLDALMHKGVFEINDDDRVVTKEGVGVTPGLDADAWLMEILPTKAHWQQPSEGGGADPRRGPKGFTGTNPFTYENFNRTEQGKIVQAKGEDYAKRLAASAGTTLGGPRPEPPKARV